MKKILLALTGLSIVHLLSAQTLLTYGKYSISKDEFVRAFNKNPGAEGDRKKALKEYLELYTNFKLKVQAANDAAMDKDATQAYELANFKRQVAENIINEQANVKVLVQEAFDRSQKDIHLAQVFIEVGASSDTVQAYRQITAAYAALQQGKEFGAVAQEFSSDAATRDSKGDLGFITVFTLPYEFETKVYSLKPSTYTTPFKSKLGYHIFKNIAERKPLGTRRVAQILVAFPPNAAPDEKQRAASKADSVYQLLVKGESFENLARLVSNDLSSATNGGLLAEFGIGQFNPTFEQAAFALAKPGDISRPFATAYGYHIIKLVETKPIPNNPNDAVMLASLQEKVSKDDRLSAAKKQVIQDKLSLLKYKASVYNQAHLFAFTDSALTQVNPMPVKTISAKTPLFSFAKQTITAGDWAKFIRAIKTSGSPLGTKSYSELEKEYVRITADEYYRIHLEDYSAAYRQQVNEFKDANLLFGIMDKYVWSKANTDTLGLRQHYLANKGKYTWEASADAIIVTAADEKVVNDIQPKLKSDLQNWRSIAESYGSKVSADSGRFELGQLPVFERTNFSPGLFTSLVKNENDGTVSFNYIINVYKLSEPRTFDDARGMVISDYQQVLEQKWLTLLKKKYPVKVNMAVFNSIK